MAIRWSNANDVMVQETYPLFFKTIREHKAVQAYDEWEAGLWENVDIPRGSPDRIDIDELKKKYNKQLTLLVKQLSPMKNICKQIRNVAERVISREHAIREGVYDIDWKHEGKKMIRDCHTVMSHSSWIQ